ncbi:anaerobic ribonucleoside-triphosphate reductase activating protein [Flagellimonas aequoris]|uniref:Anaerobic ribonucleoside-triphosphate reductase activating protein n=1 Tax=Flagellimonas aequoris TaxID=2306997 RepID=A0A418N8X3_9FLAO|nr:anaerobic ribonucleoside-triphosphate reductase activating protein [Allomuricauda aequoris]RIV71618.1 anaerobic ribonucleoside-triphosphate reductase activating protein [Allomuricauda aequoris]TXK03181.1 anaerobic ribonucleoside-triphosphate reductase activating protein [Allomuricauda aequoris]
MFYHHFQVVLQEVPGEVSLCFSISGCPLRCKGCHSPFLWKEGSGSELTSKDYQKYLDQYAGLASCVLFMGGEWHPGALVRYLKQAQELGYRTCLYTGADRVSPDILEHLTYIKTGNWDKALGGLDSPTTNQVFREVRTNKLLNHLFISK